ncbi:MAG: glycosyltransferase family 2 protein [Clostridia bacterium]|nr:glycosyltransferase family 2 protein [Clostridia bacterium]NCC43707.1 glycosyltransferase family 2 protein [Clostridia bacterium]
MTSEQQDQLIIVIPAYNEEMNIESVVKQWHPIVSKVGGASRLFVINDGSKDGTQEKLQNLMEIYPRLRAVHKKNQGHGATVLYGYRCAIEAGADYIFQTDSDGQTMPDEFWPLWEQRSRCGLLIGSRKSRQDGWQRVIVTKVLRLVLRITFGCWVEDANTPFRLMHRDQLGQVLEEIPPNHSLANVLMTVFYTKKGWNVQYFPITFRPRQGGKNSINTKRIIQIGSRAFRDFWKLGKDI